MAADMVSVSGDGAALVVFHHMEVNKWSCRFSPTGRSATTSMPSFFSCAAGPTPDSNNSHGELMAPAHKRTSRRADTIWHTRQGTQERQGWQHSLGIAVSSREATYQLRLSAQVRCIGAATAIPAWVRAREQAMRPQTARRVSTHDSTHDARERARARRWPANAPHAHCPGALEHDPRDVGQRGDSQVGAADSGAAGAGRGGALVAIASTRVLA